MNAAEERKMRRRAARKWAKENDPYFGKRRRAGEMGRHKSKAARSKKACRGRVTDW